MGDGRSGHLSLPMAKAANFDANFCSASTPLNGKRMTSSKCNEFQFNSERTERNNTVDCLFSSTFNRTFCVAGPVAWNSLPLDIRSVPTLSTFKKHSQDTFFLTFLLRKLTVSRVRTANIVVTLAMLLRLINCLIIIIIIIALPYLFYVVTR